MKRRHPKLALDRETIRSLGDLELKRIVGRDGGGIETKGVLCPAQAAAPKP